jgi:pimeloyl-ACP methyl ester carboxylesterase
MERLDVSEREIFRAAVTALQNPEIEEKDLYLAELGALTAKADAYDPATECCEEEARTGLRGDIFQSVWQEAARKRRDGELLDLAGQVRCPVLAIHGHDDSHPAEGVRKPLDQAVERFRFILLERCGHKPWIERHARDAFFHILEDEVD